MKNTTFYFSIILNILFIVGFLFLIQALGGFSYLRAKMKTRGLAGVYEHRKNLFKALPMHEDAIVFLGNSITAGGEWAEMFQNPKMVNRGIRGDMTGGMLLRLKEITKHRPAQIFLMIGVNDISVISNEKIIENYRKIIQNIRRETPSTQLIVQSILPVNNAVRDTGKENEDIVFLNAAIKKMATEFQLDYVDLYSHFADKMGNLKSELTQDGIHLDGSGYFIWKNALLHYFPKKENEKTRTITEE